MFIYKYLRLSQAYMTTWMFLKREPGVHVAEARDALDELARGLAILETIQGDNLSVEFPRWLSIGQTIGEVATEMVKMAKEFGFNVRIEFNGVSLFADADTNPNDIVAGYWKGLNQLKQTSEKT